MDEILARIDEVARLANRARSSEHLQLKENMSKDTEKMNIISRFIIAKDINLATDAQGKISDSQLDDIYLRAKGEESFRWKGLSCFGMELNEILRRSPLDAEISILFSDLGYWVKQDSVLKAEPDWSEALNILSHLRADVCCSKPGRLGAWERIYCREMPHVQVHVFWVRMTQFYDVL